MSQVQIEGKNYEKVQLSDVDVYFNEAGMLVIADVTAPSVEGDLLGEAAKAYTKAFELGEKAEKVDPKLQEIVNRYYEDAYNAYQLGNKGYSPQKSCQQQTQTSFKPQHTLLLTI